MQDSKELAIRDAQIRSFELYSNVFRKYFTSPFNQYKDFVGKSFKVLTQIRPFIPSTEDVDGEDDVYSIQFTDCNTIIHAFGHEVCQLKYELCIPKFENSPEKKLINKLKSEITQLEQVIQERTKQDGICISDLECVLCDIHASIYDLNTLIVQ